MVPKDWHTQNSTLVTKDGLLTRLKRLMPIVGCEADAVAYNEDERHILRFDEAHIKEDRTVLRDGSYSSGPRSLTGALTARIEHCITKAVGERIRGIMCLERSGEGDPWALAEVEVHCERRTGDYNGGTLLEACGYNLTDISGQPVPTTQQLAGPWRQQCRADFRLDSSGGFVATSPPAVDTFVISEEARLLLPGCCWCTVATSRDGNSKVEFGWLSDDVCKFTTRCFDDERLSMQSFVTGSR